MEEDVESEKDKFVGQVEAVMTKLAVLHLMNQNFPRKIPLLFKSDMKILFHKCIVICLGVHCSKNE